MITDTQAFIIASLRDSGKAHGHAIAVNVEQRWGRPISVATLYKALHSLEGQGFLRGKWELQTEADAGRPRRRYYQVTGLGLKALTEYQAHVESVARSLRPASRTAANA